MPQANIWIKKENWDIWQSIYDKSAYVNDLISQKSSVPAGIENQLKELQKEKNIVFCEHNFAKGFCKKGC